MPQPYDGEYADRHGGYDTAALDETIAFWEPIAGGRKLHREDARQIRQNLTGFFRVLMDWERGEKRARAGGEARGLIT